MHEKIYDQMIEKFKHHIEEYKIGDPLDQHTTHGPQVDKAQFDKVLGYIKEGQNEGAKMVIGGKRHGKKGYFIEPTMFVDVKDEMKIAKEEIFGPVMQVLKFKDIQEVIKRANDNPYGLAAGVFSQSVDNV